MKTPPPLISFSDPETFLSVAYAELPAHEHEEIATLVQQGFPPITSPASLALLLGVSPSLIVAMARKPSNYYRTFTIQRGNKKRPIATPRIALKLIQKWLAVNLCKHIQFQKHVHGFVPGRSILSAAKIHQNSNWIVSLDIQNFFGSVTDQHVFDVFTWLGYSRMASHLLVDLTTLNGALPQGAPTSPILANLAFIDTDDKLADYCKANKFRLTRYADDISVSGKTQRPADLTKRISAIIQEDMWHIAGEKVRTYSKPSCLHFLGLRISDGNVRVPKAIRRRARQAKFLLEKQDIELTNKSQLIGILAFTNWVDQQI